MSTHSRIGIKMDDGSVHSVYCHWDGGLWPGGVGDILFRHYHDRNKIEALIALGDLSCLRAEVKPPEGARHSFEDPFPDVTVAYTRDRNEASPGVVTHGLGEFAKASAHDPTYLWDGGWVFWPNGADPYTAPLDLIPALVKKRLVA